MDIAWIGLKSGNFITIKDYDENVSYKKCVEFFDKIIDSLKERALDPEHHKGGYFRYNHTLIFMDEITYIIVNEELYNNDEILCLSNDQEHTIISEAVASATNEPILLIDDDDESLDGCNELVNTYNNLLSKFKNKHNKEE